MISLDQVVSLVNSYLPEPHASLLNGILFGIPLYTQTTFVQKLRIVGLMHVVVLSGTNITILGYLAGAISQFLGKKLSVCFSIGCIVLFVYFVGPQPPLVRAACMGILSYIAILTGRQYTALWALLLSCLCIAVFFPQWLKTLSFQLSVSATLGIILFGRKQSNNKPQSVLFSTLQENIRVSCAAQLFTTPILFFAFRKISLISLLANLLVSWTITPIMILGICMSVLGSVHFSFGIPPAYLSFGLLTYFIWIVELLSQIPFAQIQF